MNFEVKLFLIEGRDLGFITTNFKIIATLDGTPIESSPFQSGAVINFNSDMVWTSSKENIRKMRNYKVPVRLDFYKEGDKANKCFGYIILNMKAAQFITGDLKVPIREETHKVCGTPKEAIGCHPEVVLSLRIEAANEVSEMYSSRTVDNGSIHEKLASCRTSISALAFPAEEERVISPLEIFEDVGAGERLHTETTQRIEELHKFCLEISLQECNWLGDLDKIHLRFHHAKAEVKWSAHETIDKVCSGQTTDLASLPCKFNFVEEPSKLLQILAEVPPSLTVCEIDQGRPRVLGVAKLAIPSLGLSEEAISASTEIKRLRSKERLATVSYKACLIDNGVEIVQQLSIVNSDDLLLGESIKTELERWKEQEREKFQKDFEEKLKVELSQLQSLSEEKEAEMQIEVSKRISICRDLQNELQATIEQWKSKDRFQLDEKLKEERLEFHSRIKDKDVIIRDLQFQIEELLAMPSGDSTSQQIYDLNHRIKTLEKNLQKANDTKTFFKNQWVRAVRELLRVKTGGVSDIPVRLKIKKEKLEQLGLSDLFDDFTS